MINTSDEKDERMRNLVSVLMPVYNVEDYISDAINSITKQTYSNFELILIDDCSKDKTFEICKKFAVEDARIHLFRNEVNQGLVSTLNYGLSNCSGNYIIRMDGDDISEVDRIEKMKAYLDNNPDIDVIGTSAYTIDSEGTLLGKSIFLSDQLLIKKTMLLQTPLVHIWMTYKKVYDELNGYREIIASEDYDFVLRCITLGYKVSNISDYYGYSIRINRKGNTSSTSGVKKLKAKIFVTKLYKERIKNGFDSYSIDKMSTYVRTSYFEENMYKISNSFLYKAISNKNKRQYLAMIGNMICALISPWQIWYLVNRIRFFVITK